jgi:hypothetical protein
LNDISTWHALELYWVPRHAGVEGNEIANNLARGGSIQKLIGHEPSLGVSRQNIGNKIKHWLGKQHLALWPGLVAIRDGLEK